MAKKDLAQIAEVVREGRHIVLPAEPKPMPARMAADLLYKLAEQEEETVGLDVTFATPPFAGALALVDTLRRLFGFTISASVFGDRVIEVPVGPDEHREVIWGAFEVPGTSIILDCGVARVGRMIAFRVRGQCQAKDKPLAAQLFAEVREEIRERSIYRGKAIMLRQDGESLELDMPDSIRFMRVDPMLRANLILNSHTADAVETELFTPVEHYAFAKQAWGVRMNRVVLLSGTYGTGKSLTGSALAAVAVENNATFILLKNVAALPEALEFVRMTELQRAIIFAEDVDRVMSGDRNIDKDTLLNLLSGVESATSEVTVVLTTNNIETIHPAMIRRFQAVVEYQLPDEQAAERLVMLYGNGRVSGNLTAAPKVLAGQMPALIKDTVETAKLRAIRFGREVITDDDLVYAAKQLETRARLATREVKPEPLGAALAQVGAGLLNGQGEALHELVRKVADIYDATC